MYFFATYVSSQLQKVIHIWNDMGVNYNRMKKYIFLKYSVPLTCFFHIFTACHIFTFKYCTDMSGCFSNICYCYRSLYMQDSLFPFLLHYIYSLSCFYSHAGYCGKCNGLIISVLAVLTRVLANGAFTFLQHTYMSQVKMHDGVGIHLCF